MKCDDPYSLCSTRYLTKQKDNKEYIHRLQFLFFIEEVETTKGATNLFCCVDFNLDSKFVSFKFNSYALESYNNSISIVEKLISILQDKDGIFKRLKVVTGSYNQSTTRKAIQSLFINLSSQAEDLLEKKANPNIKKEVKKFLETIEIPDSDDYINQIISVVYQNISKEFKKTLFNDGWVFRFVFKEGDKTRASSSTEDFEPVYGKKVYWNLKELMFKNRGTDFIEAGFYWLTNQSKEPVAVKLEQKNNIVIMQYYKQEFNNEKRREKEDFVLRKFREGISKKS
ncbi:hypothetical protein [Priestia megaterium]|uniref:hypothetical protein n=1 Tax=Priestia megaterium TaxID=1404 RepID=UPI001FB1EDE2|nr:hypothetical protein [Priestia megaterium]